jgi:ubiquinone biosynthesis protein UbiJ
MTEPVAASIDVVISHNGATVESDSTTEADVTFRCDISTAVLVIFRCLPLSDTIADGRVHVEGDRELAITLSQSFQGG